MNIIRFLRSAIFKKLPNQLKVFLIRVTQNSRQLDIKKLNRLLRLGRFGFRATYLDNFNLITRMGTSAINDLKFQMANDVAIRTSQQKRPLWTTHVLTWAAENGLRVPGDFVECGVEKGFAAHVILDYLQFSNLSDRRFFLLDSWSGVDLANLTPEEKVLVDGSFNDAFSGFFDSVQESFIDFPNVVLVRGFIPTTLSEVKTNEVAFLHIDLNSVRPEVEAMKFFWPKMSKGAIIILDDYNQPGRDLQRVAMDKLGLELGYKVLSLPTGQGLVVV